MRVDYGQIKKGIFCLLLYMILTSSLILFSVPFSFYYIATLGLCLFIGFMEVEYKVENRKIEKALGQLEWFLSEVRHRYYVHGMVDEAVREAMEACKYEDMKQEAGRICEVLLASDSKAAVASYRLTQKNRFFCMFVTLCLLVIEFGDQQYEGNSLFLHNIKNLRGEIHIELQSRRSIKNTFAGLTFVLVLPICTLKLIENWGLENLIELTSYYHGNYGIIFYLLLFLLTSGLYYLFYIVKVPYRIDMKSHKFLEVLVRFSTVRRFIKNYSNRYYYRILKLERLLKEVGETIDVSMFLIQRFLISMAALIGSLCLSIGMSQDFYPWYLFLVCLGIAGITYWIPYWLLLYRRKAMLLCMEEEVLQFHSILMMLMYFNRISTYELLEAMEEFSIIFKQSLRHCINEYESGQKEALLQLKEKEHCQAFRKLVDNLLMCDEIGVIRALDEIAIERNYHREKRKQVSDYNLQKKGAICQFLAFLPLFITVGFYLIVPFVVVSITKLLEISNEVLGS